MSAEPEKILVIRNDKLGDFCLTLPTFAYLKACFPNTELHALVPAYTRPIAEACPFIDQIIVDPGPNATKQQKSECRLTIQKQGYAVALTLFSTTRIGWLLKRCHIPVRIAPATKLAQIFYNRRITQRRSRSLKPEYEYNIDLARAVTAHFQKTCDTPITAPYLEFNTDEIQSIKTAFCAKHNIKDKLLIFIHPGSGGSANNLSLSQYADLVTKLAESKQYHFVISAGPGEIEHAHVVKSILDNHAETISCSVYESDQGLRTFTQHIAFADLFISGSTGPLHIAGALDRATVGFYTNRQSATSLRWQTLSAAEHRLAFSPPADAEAEDMSKVDIEGASREILAMLGRIAG